MGFPVVFGFFCLFCGFPFFYLLFIYMVKKRPAPFTITPTTNTLEKHTAHCHPSTKTHFFPSNIRTHPFLKHPFQPIRFFCWWFCVSQNRSNWRIFEPNGARTGGVSTEDTTMGLQRDDWSSKCWNFRSGWRLSTWLHRRPLFFFLERGEWLKLWNRKVVWFQRDFFLKPRSLGEMIQFDEHIFQDGLVQPATSIIWIYNPHTKDATNWRCGKVSLVGDFFSLWIPWAWNGEGWPLIDSYMISILK